VRHGHFWPGCAQIGMVQLTRKGRIRMKIGCATLDVTAGVPSQARHEIRFLNLRTGDIVPVAADMPCAVASVDMSSLFR
jgi:hypothetical protein